MIPADDVFEKSYNLAVPGEDLSAYLPISLRTLIDAESVDGNAFATSPVARRPMLSPQGHDRKVPRLHESGSAADKRFQETLRLGPSGMSGIGHTSHVVSPRSRNNGSQWALRGFNYNESNASSIVNGNGIAAYQQSQRVHYRHSQRYDPRASNDWRALFERSRRVSAHNQSVPNLAATITISPGISPVKSECDSKSDPRCQISS